MKSVIVVVMLALLSACSSTQPAKTYQGSGPSANLRVKGVGKNVEEAKTNGFTTAIEIAVGSAIVSNKEARNDKMVRDEIINHSAGYVDNYTIVSRIDSNNTVTVIMDVQVKSSKIHERIFGKFSDQNELQGNRMSSQFSTYMEDRRTGDKLLNTVLSDYPSNAYNVKNKLTEFKLDKNRNAVVRIEYELAWNFNYLKALNEVLKVTEDTQSSSFKQERIYVQSKDPSAWLVGSTDRYNFSDGARARTIKQRFTGPVYVIATISDANGSTLYVGCSDPIYMVPAHIVDPLIISGNQRDIGEILIKIHPTEPEFYKIQNADKVVLTHSSRACYNSN